VEADAQLSAAKGFHNRVWELLEMPQRTQAQDDEMLHGTHASCAHWMKVGTAANHARGEWQCSRVYVVLGRAEPALYHARRCLELCQEAGPGVLEAFDLPYAHEAVARASALAGDRDTAAEHLERARALAAGIADDEDRELVEADLATIQV
jgi:hypothetical protein